MPAMQTEQITRHSLFEDIQALLVGPMFVAFAVLLFQHAGLLTGGTVGLAFLLHYLTGWSMAWIVFVLNLPFYLFAWRAMGWVFTVKTFICVGLLSLYTALLPQVIVLQSVDRLFAAVMGGFLVGVGLLMIVRHKASLGGLGVLALYFQNTRGWPAGKVQMVADALILVVGLVIRDPLSIGLSIVGALALNLVLAVNHKAGRYLGT
ncbi:YitT family protein [Azonexus sp. IMCC34842]|uniref:YitT family protein n=1 Tax=Azonexus sp. IMCC34842 TaxID=3420950 RepID=UPI003D0B5CC6